jgi:CheY-like chemotaxis protein
MSELSKILIVDDNKDNLLSLHTLIKKNFPDVHVIEANSGLTALSILMKETVDLIILDIQMPNLNGFETAKMIRARPKMENIPIVFLTAAYKSEEFQDKGYALGAVDYLTKPIEPAELTDKLRLYLRFIQQKHQQEQNELSDNSQALVKNKQIAEAFKALQSSLDTMIACTEKLEKKALYSAHNDYLPDLQTIHRESKQLQDLINNMLAPNMRREK